MKIKWKKHFKMNYLNQRKIFKKSHFYRYILQMLFSNVFHKCFSQMFWQNYLLSIRCFFVFWWIKNELKIYIIKILYNFSPHPHTHIILFGTFFWNGWGKGRVRSLRNKLFFLFIRSFLVSWYIQSELVITWYRQKKF